MPERYLPEVSFLIVGTPRSGTTLVQRLALELSGVGMSPETHFFSAFATDLLRRRHFPLEDTTLASELRAFASSPQLAGAAFDTDLVYDSLAGYCNSPLEMFDAIVAALAGPADLLGEKTPEHLRWWRPLSRARPNLRFVAVVRDPRAVVASNINVPFRESLRTAWGEDCHLALAVHWRQHQRLLLAMTAELGPSRSLLLRYEDVVVDPAHGRQALAALLDRGAAVARRAAATRVVLPWETWKHDAFADVTYAKLESWRGELTFEQSEAVASLCQPEMSRLGYGTRSWARRLARRLETPRQSRRRLRGLARGLTQEQAGIDQTRL